MIRRQNNVANLYPLGLYTDDSPGLKVDPVIVLVLSLGFIFSVVALHSKPISAQLFSTANTAKVIAKVVRKFS